MRWQFANPSGPGIPHPIFSEQAVDEMLPDPGRSAMFIFAMFQQSVLPPELDLERLRAMADYVQAAAPLRPRQSEATHNHKSTWL